MWESIRDKALSLLASGIQTLAMKLLASLGIPGMIGLVAVAVVLLTLGMKSVHAARHMKLRTMGAWLLTAVIGLSATWLAWKTPIGSGGGGGGDGGHGHTGDG